MTTAGCYKARELIEKKLFLTEDVPHRVLAFAGPEHKNWHVSLKQGGFHNVISGLPGRRNRTLISETPLRGLSFSSVSFVLAGSGVRFFSFGCTALISVDFTGLLRS